MELNEFCKHKWEVIVVQYQGMLDLVAGIQHCHMPTAGCLGCFGILVALLKRRVDKPWRMSTFSSELLVI